MAASEALDVDFGAETFHHDGAADSVGGADGMLGLSGGNMAGGFEGEGPDFDTIGGLIAHEMGHVPRRGEKHVLAGLQFVVLHTRAGAVRWFKVSPGSQTSTSEPKA